jgi:hypothetical protein
VTDITTATASPPAGLPVQTRERASSLLAAVSALVAADLPLEHHPRRRGLLSALALVHGGAGYSSAHGVCAAYQLQPSDPEVQPTAAAAAAALLELARACPSDDLADAVRHLRRTWIGRRAPGGADAPEIVMLRAAAQELAARQFLGRASIIGGGGA